MEGREEEGGGILNGEFALFGGGRGRGRGRDRGNDGEGKGNDG